ncbi:HupE/UreJ family protein [Rhodobacteraceae bacterium RKSG542]|uniref:HupE/UreJ family protein n=1 Tax=Pseudovibrio flavus TaxID=2529854 RepID=UPI0012BC3863|nr:HupE/UreJ family protein [Pseudovibrio flavus]MTI17939.1 HupE/UreJ family protein [Pseudovibrio flavus]
MLKTIGLTAFLTVLASSANAHSLMSANGGVISGLLHPLSGVDHILAMVCAGVWASFLGRKSSFVLPVAFITAMTVGYALTFAGVTVPLIETGIVASVIAFGIAIAMSLKVSLVAGTAIIAFLALFHGAAHGVEAPVGSAAGYVIGFVAASFALVCSGVVMGKLGQSNAGKLSLRVAGALAALGGFMLAATA